MSLLFYFYFIFIFHAFLRPSTHLKADGALFLSARYVYETQHQGKEITYSNLSCPLLNISFKKVLIIIHRKYKNVVTQFAFDISYIS